MLLSLVSVFMSTFVIFPAVFVNGHYSFTDSLSKQLLFVLILFNVVDTIGRYLGGKIHLPEKIIATFAIVRFLFIPSSLIINLYDESLPDWIKLTNLILFAVSNGYTSTQCCIKAPSFARDEYK